MSVATAASPEGNELRNVRQLCERYGMIVRHLYREGSGIVLGITLRGKQLASFETRITSLHEWIHTLGRG